MPKKMSRWVAWWYVAIGVGFLLLAIQHAVIGDQAWLIGVRVIIGLGFAFLGWTELRSKKVKRR
jgi:hypothetical protein